MKGRLPRLLVFGAGGHAKVVIDVIARAGVGEVVAVVDRVAEPGAKLGRYPVQEESSALRSISTNRAIDACIVAVGSGTRREIIVNRIREARSDMRFLACIHPTAVVASSAHVGEGSVLMAGAVLNPDSRVGEFCIINTHATVEHDCVVGSYTSLSPHAAMGGRARIGPNCFVGMGAIIAPDVSIGRGTAIGAGSAVLDDVQSGVLAIGSPAQVARRISAGEAH